MTQSKLVNGSNSLRAVLHHEGSVRATYLLEMLAEEARRAGIVQPSTLNTPYVNTIPPEREERADWDRDIEHRIRSIIRWNAMAIILRANKESSELGGHIASFQSAATLYDIGFGHFWHAPSANHGGDLIYMQGHSAPGIYARAFVEGRLSEEALLAFRQEAGGQGLSSYPHPWLMPDFWQFPTVSMGLGPLMAIYQARFLKYLHGRGIADTAARKVWAFMGDGEMDEPESLGAISLGGREQLDNLIFVINCNLQRLDGPVRGNGKIVQELEGMFRGAGWNVIKVLWGSGWDPLLAKDASGMLRKRMEECVDGEYQDFKSKNGAYVRQQFFGKYPETAALVKDMSDDDIWALRRGGSDPVKVYAAYAAAVKHAGQPTVILAKTVKGYGMGEAGEGQMISHQQKKMGLDALRKFRDRFAIPVTDAKLEEIPFLKLAEGGPEQKYLQERRRQLGGSLPQRRRKSASLVPELSPSARLASTNSAKSPPQWRSAHPQPAPARQDVRKIRRADLPTTSRLPPSPGPPAPPQAPPFSFSFSPPAALCVPRHRRFRPQRLPGGVAEVLRGQPPLRGGRGAQVAGRRRGGAETKGCQGDRRLWN